jgi:pimeloyl-ACP methyl ester carboxylesterase
MHEFRIDIAESELVDLYHRLQRSRRPRSVTEDGGLPLVHVDALVKHWLEAFDWRRQEALLNQLPQFIQDVSGTQLHYLHARCSRRSAMPLVLLHGWPGSFVEMRHVVPRLARDFHVIVPSLPGYGFSPLPAAGYSNARIAEVVANLMSALGYERFGVQGGDWGAGIGTWLALKYARRVVGLHLNYIPGSYAPFVDGEHTDEELAFLRRKDKWAAEAGAYGHVQRTRPLTIAYGLTDSPIGLAAWVAEKFVEWSDPRTRPGLDDILTNISLYWFTNTIASSVRLYFESERTPLAFDRTTRVGVPTGILRCPLEAPFPPRSWIERGYDVTHWTDAERGGHFAALEVPDAFVADVCRFFGAHGPRAV